MSTLLQTILPRKLRGYHKNYYSIGQDANQFVVINVDSFKTGLEINIGEWSATYDSNISPEAKPLIALQKADKLPRLFYQKALNVLRRDEFEWFFIESLHYRSYYEMSGEASSGNTAAITIYTYFRALAKKLKIEPNVIFLYFSNFNYDPHFLMKKPW